MKPGLVLYGASGHGRVVADAARLAGFEILGWADDDRSRHGGEIAGAPVVSAGLAETIAWARAHHCRVVVTIGDNSVRARIFSELEAAGAELATIVHPRATIASSAKLGVGSVVLAQAVVNPDASIGRNVILNTGATVDHDCVIGDHAHLSPGVHLGGTVSVGEGCHLGVGVAVRNNLAIGRWTLVGVGAAVVADLPDHTVAFGVPAKPRRPAPARW